MTVRDIEPDHPSARDLMRLAPQLARVGWWTYDVRGSHVLWSDQVCAIHEVPAGTAPTLLEAVAFYAPEWRRVVTEQFEACVWEGTPFTLEVQILTGGGRRVWVRTTGVAERDETGTIRTVQGAVQDISELKEVAEQNRRLAERLSTTLESITDALFTLDREWRYTYLNREAERMAKCKRDQLIGRSIWEMFPLGVGTEFQSRLEHSLASQSSVEFEYFYEPYNLWMEVRAYPSELGMALNIRDVSAERDTREAMRTSEERFRLLSKAAQDAIWDWDFTSNELWWNEGFDSLFGIITEQNGLADIGSWKDRIHPADRKDVLDAVQTVIDSGESTYTGEYRFLRADGTYAYVLDRGYLIRRADGSPTRMIGGLTDITRRRAVEEQLGQQASLLDKAQDAIMVCELDNTITYWNRSAERLYGYSAEEAVGRARHSLLRMDDLAFTGALARLAASGDWAGELNNTGKDGRSITVETRWTLVCDDNGLPRSVLVIDTDISERKKLEQQFLRAQRMESIGTLAGGIAHDLNNVLAPIMLSIPLLMDDEADPERLDILKTIEASAQRGAEMVRQVLSFGRGVEGRRELVDPADVITGTTRIIADTFPKNVQVRTFFSENLPAVCGDATQLHQVLLNLCVNARDAMPSGGTLSITAQAEVLDEEAARFLGAPGPGPFVQLSVTDTGTGMSQDVTDRIFEPFFTTKDVGKGTGLGLSTSMAIVRSHGGFIHVESKLGHGTAFRVFLPSSPGAANMEGVAAAPPLPRGSGQLILVVDDEAAVREVLQKTLTSYGYQAIVAADGVEAITTYANQRDKVSVVLTDMMMPLLDGPATIQALRRINPEVRVVAASGGGDGTAPPPGVHGYLLKPYTVESLLTTLHEVLSRQSFE